MIFVRNTSLLTTLDCDLSSCNFTCTIVYLPSSFLTAIVRWCTSTRFESALVSAVDQPSSGSHASVASSGTHSSPSANCVPSLVRLASVICALTISIQSQRLQRSTAALQATGSATPTTALDSMFFIHIFMCIYIILYVYTHTYMYMYACIYIHTHI